jgi:hypothetical protein
LPSGIILFGIHAQDREQKRELVALARGVRQPRQLAVDQLLEFAPVHDRISNSAAVDA